MLSRMAQELQTILCQSVQNCEVEMLSELDNNIKEADVRLIPHATHAVLAGTERIVIHSSDNDNWSLHSTFGICLIPMVYVNFG